MSTIVGPAPVVAPFAVPQAPTTHSNPASAPAVPAAEQATQVQLPLAVSAAGSPTASGGDDKFEQAIEQIASSFKGTYAVSDKEFSIFKDATGTLITRYVSLRDGSVTYVPNAPTVVRPVQAAGSGDGYVSVKA